MPRIADASNIEEEFNDSMRVEWAKARAWKIRWQEELLLVKEEMRQVIVYHEWRAGWWQERSSLQTNEDPSILSDISGYAHKQAVISICMAEQCALYWLQDLKEKEITPSWATAYESLLSQLPPRCGTTQVDEECEDMSLDNNGNEDNEDQSSDENEGDFNVGEDDYEDFDFDD